MQIRNEKVRVTARFHEQGSVLRGDAEGFCDGFDILISMDSEETPQKINELIRLARRMCFTEKALQGQTEISVHSQINGEVLPEQ